MNTRFCDRQTFTLFKPEPRGLAGLFSVKTVCVLDSSPPSNFPIFVACLLLKKVYLGKQSKDSRSRRKHQTMILRLPLELGRCVEFGCHLGGSENFQYSNHWTKNDPHRMVLSRGSWMNRLQRVEAALDDRGMRWQKNNV